MTIVYQSFFILPLFLLFGEGIRNVLRRVLFSTPPPAPFKLPLFAVSLHCDSFLMIKGDLTFHFFALILVRAYQLYLLYVYVYNIVLYCAYIYTFDLLYSYVFHLSLF